MGFGGLVIWMLWLVVQHNDFCREQLFEDWFRQVPIYTLIICFSILVSLSEKSKILNIYFFRYITRLETTHGDTIRWSMDDTKLFTMALSIQIEDANDIDYQIADSDTTN